MTIVNHTARFASSATFDISLPDIDPSIWTPTSFDSAALPSLLAEPPRDPALLRQDIGTGVINGSVFRSSVEPYTVKEDFSYTPITLEIPINLPAPAQPQPNLWDRFKSWAQGLTGVLTRGNSIEPYQAFRVGQGTEISYKGFWGTTNSFSGIVVKMDAGHIILAVPEKGQVSLKRFKTSRILDYRAASISVSDGAFEKALASYPIRLEQEARTSDRFREYLDFNKTDHWADVAPKLEDEFSYLDAFKTKADKHDYLRAVGNDIIERIKEHLGVKEIGFHYNLNGGQREQYIQGGGIRTGRGDIALQYGATREIRDQVYFFRSSEHDLFDVLNQYHPKMPFFPNTRMGSVLMLFDLSAEFFARARESGAIQNETAIYMDFDMSKLSRICAGEKTVGVSYDTFLAPPLSVFYGTKSKLHMSGWLGRDQETLATMRYLEAVFLGDSEVTFS